jgi:2Fe-2S ferredoxin
MSKLLVTAITREQLELEAPVGQSVMETLRDAGVDGLLMLCGGVRSCATCHVVIDPAWMAAVGPPGDEENDLLDSIDNRTPTSRLSCQIQMSAALDGLHVTIPPEA